MWILPRQLHTSPFVPDTEALISDSNEQSQLCAQSLLVRSKPSPARTWSLKWKRDSWTRHLSGRILRPSHGPSFVTAWTSSLAATRASRSAQPASDSAPKTQDTSGRLSQMELIECDQVSVSLKTSRDISRWGCPTSSKTWQDWVSERRGAYSARVKSARRISGSGCSSWPTIRASEYKDVGPVGSKSHDHMLGKHYLCAVVTQEECNGQAAPASSSSGGSRQELSWATPTSAMTFPIVPRENCASHSRAGHVGNQLGRQALQQWATPQAHDAQGPKTPEQIEAMRAKGHGVKNLNEQAAWGTPTARDHKSGRGNNDRDYKELTPMVERQQSGKLNPRWVETLMGLPIGWTMPSCLRPLTIAPTSCDSSATESCRPRQSERSEFLLAN